MDIGILKLTNKTIEEKKSAYKELKTKDSFILLVEDSWRINEEVYNHISDIIKKYDPSSIIFNYFDKDGSKVYEDYFSLNKFYSGIYLPRVIGFNTKYVQEYTDLEKLEMLNTAIKGNIALRVNDFYFYNVERVKIDSLSINKVLQKLNR